MVTVVRPFGKLVAKPYEVRHTTSELSELAKSLKSLKSGMRVVLEHTVLIQNGQMDVSKILLVS